MNRIIVAFAASLVLALNAGAAEDKKELTPQQQKMADCSTKAKGLKGDEYKKARNDCLKGETTAKKELSPQQQKMADCNAKAKGLKGEEFKKTRDTCLKS
jgi:hypothetical protein